MPWLQYCWLASWAQEKERQSCGRHASKVLARDAETRRKRSWWQRRPQTGKLVWPGATKPRIFERVFQTVCPGTAFLLFLKRLFLIQ